MAAKVIALLIYCLPGFFFTCCGLTMENQIIKDILEERKKALGAAELIAKPTKSGAPITVEFALGLVQIADIMEEEQSIVFQTWEYVRWVDEYLTWDPAKYQNVTSVIMPTDLMWQPDLILYHVIEVIENKAVPGLATNYYNGVISLVRERTYKVSCGIDVRRFPYDTHNCNLTYGLWIHTQDVMNLVFYNHSDRGIFLDQFKESLKWNLSSISVDVRYKQFSCCPGVMVYFDYILEVKRQAAFLTFVLIIPAVLLAILTVLLYMLPCDSTAKVDIGLSIFLSYFLLLVILVESAPPIGSHMPMLGNFFTINLILTAGTMFAVTYISHLRDKTIKGEPFPPAANRVLDFLGCVMLVNTGSKRLANRGQNGVVRNDPCNQIHVTDDQNNEYEKPSQGNTKRSLRRQRTVDAEDAPSKEAAVGKPGCSSGRRSAASSPEKWLHLSVSLNRVFLLCYLIIYLILTTVVFCIA